MLNRKFLLIFCFVFIAVFLFTVSAVLISNRAENESENAVNAGVSSGDTDLEASQSAKQEPTYFVTAGDGIVCIYSCTENSQILTDAITYIDLYSLDSDTKRSLQSGIVFENRMDVIRFIENISS